MGRAWVPSPSASDCLLFSCHLERQVVYINDFIYFWKRLSEEKRNYISHASEANHRSGNWLNTNSKCCYTSYLSPDLKAFVAHCSRACHFVSEVLRKNTCKIPSQVYMFNFNFFPAIVLNLRPLMMSNIELTWSLTEMTHKKLCHWVKMIWP